MITRVQEGTIDDTVASVSTSGSLYLKITNSGVDSIVEKRDRSGSLFVSKDKKMFFTELKTLSRKGVATSVRKPCRRCRAAG